MPIDAWLRRLERMDPLHIELGLDRVKAVWQRLPQFNPDTPVVIVGGTNGKGSCVLLLEQLLSCAGLSVGSYLSPHLVRFNERIRFHQQEISDQALCVHLEKVEQARGNTQLTYFEFTTLAALSFFADQSPDAVILEVGLGGRLDAVNIMDADIAILTSVDLDHQDWLGADIESIGREKAGIFRAGGWAITADRSMPQSVYQEAERTGVRLLQRGIDFDLRDAMGGMQFDFQRISRNLPILGVSETSLSAALCAASLLLDGLSERVLAGLDGFQLPARFERVQVEGRECILDCAHNPAAARNLARSLESEGIGSVDVILGMMSDKDVRGFVAALAPQVKRWMAVAPATPRAMPMVDLVKILQQCTAGPVLEIGDMASLDSQILDPVRPTLVTGSFYTVGEFIKYQVGDRRA